MTQALATPSPWGRTLQVLLVAALYLAFAKLGFLFALPPGNVTPIWIPSGLALAALVTWRWQGAAGVWLGSFAVNASSLGWAGSAGLVAAAIATGSTLQGAAAASLLRRYVIDPAQAQAFGPDPRLATLRAVLIVLPCSLIAALLGVGALVGGHFAQRSNVLDLFMTWWLGDLVGILIVGMPLLALRGLMARLGRDVLPGTVALACSVAGAGLLGAVVLVVDNRATFDAEIQSKTAALADEIKGELEAHALFGRSVSALMTDAEKINAQRFNRFSAELLEVVKDRAVSAVSFLPRITAAERPNFEESLRLRGAVNHQIWQRHPDGSPVVAPWRQEFFPVQYIFPVENNAAAIGFDVNSEPLRSAALRQAREENTLISTPPLQLVQDGSTGKSLLVVDPIWQEGRPAKRRPPPEDGLLGFSSTLLRLTPLFERVVTSQPLGRLEAALLFRAEPGKEFVLVANSAGASYPADVQAWMEGGKQEAPFSFAGGLWTLVLKPPSHEIWAFRGISLAPAISLILFLVLAGAIVTNAAAARQKQMVMAQSEDKFRSLLESAPDGMVIVDAQGRINLVNAQVETMFGYRRQELIGQTVEMLVPEATRNRHTQQRAAFQQTPGNRRMGTGLELNGRRKDGSEFPVEISLSTIEAGGTRLVAAGIRDITVRKRFEQKLREAHMLKAIGQLTGGLAHDFNNLLALVVGNLDEMAAQLHGQDEKLMRRLNTALEAAMKGAELTRSLLAVAQRQPLRVEAHDLNALLKESLPVLCSSMGMKVSLHQTLSEQPLLVRVDAAGLSNALLNVMINAGDAMQEQAGEHQLHIRTRKVSAAEAGLGGTGNYAVLEVQDNGPGMSEEVRKRAFEPFFSTKQASTSRGTGLGLAMVKGFCEQLGGTATIDSTEGQGTTVRLYLPLDDND